VRTPWAGFTSNDSTHAPYGVPFLNGVAHVPDDWVIYRSSRGNMIPGVPIRVVDLLRDDLHYEVRELEPGATPLVRDRYGPELSAADKKKIVE
jgi:hypothetical protein